MKKLKLSQEDVDKLVAVERKDVSTLIHGAGRNDVLFQVTVGDSPIWQYDLWKTMIRRSFNGEHKARNPAYQDVTCCDEWLSFASFVEWVNKEVGYSGKPVGLELDKDLIVKGNRIYSPECCSFVPQAVNLLLTDRANHRGEFPVGVHKPKNRKKFQVLLSTGGKLKDIGSFNTPEEAFLAYKTAKESHIKAVATRHKDVLSPAVFESLMNWEIEP